MCLTHSLPSGKSDMHIIVAPHAGQIGLKKASGKTIVTPHYDRKHLKMDIQQKPKHLIYLQLSSD